MALFALLTGWIAENEKDEAHEAFRDRREARHRGAAGAPPCGWRANGLKNPNDAGAGATDYLRLMGITMLA